MWTTAGNPSGILLPLGYTRRVVERPPTIRRPDTAPVDAHLSGSRSPDAFAANGEVVSGQELEAAGELLRVAKRLPWVGGRVDGFAVYRVYRWIRQRHVSRSQT